MMMRCILRDLIFFFLIRALAHDVGMHVRGFSMMAIDLL